MDKTDNGMSSTKIFTMAVSQAAFAARMGSFLSPYDLMYGMVLALQLMMEAPEYARALYDELPVTVREMGPEVAAECIKNMPIDGMFV